MTILPSSATYRDTVKIPAIETTHSRVGYLSAGLSGVSLAKLKAMGISKVLSKRRLVGPLPITEGRGHLPSLLL
jgi:hypothetical protein